MVGDLESRRIGSGGSTLECLRVVANRERARGRGASVRELLRGLRILIVHAGGDSRRLPAYGPCGKIFIPVPGARLGAMPLTLFDRLTPGFLDLPEPDGDAGQTVIAAGDALLLFDASGIACARSGMTMLASQASSEEAARHGVFCKGEGGRVRLYLQKPSRAEQEAMGALDSAGRALLDIGVTNLDEAAAAALLEAFEIGPAASGDFEWSAEMRSAVLDRGIDLYREICCAMGAEATLAHYLRTVRTAGSQWSDAALAGLFPRLQAIPFQVGVLASARFLHFGSTRQLVSSGNALLGAPPTSTVLLNNQGNQVTGAESWVEGCRLGAALQLGGRNVVIGIDVDSPLALPARAAIDVVPGDGVAFVRCYGVDDSFKDATFCGQPLPAWLEAVGASPADVWDGDDRTLWTARVFPAENRAANYRRWLWMYEPAAASAEQTRAWREASRYSAAEIARRTDQEAFHRRRTEILQEAAC